jgi:FkbM family methyltransferase
MGAFRKRVRNLLEKLTGYEIARFGDTSFIFIDKKHGADAWLSRNARIRSMMNTFEIDLVMDVGANEGWFAQGLRSFYSGEIFSFEPVSSVFEKLAAAAASDPNWHVYKVALGSEESQQTIHVSNETSFSSLLKANDRCAQLFGDKSRGTKEEVVSVRRLDTLLNEIAPDFGDKRIFLKMDTQGYDMEVFKGLGNTLNHVVALLSEVSLISLYEGMPHWTENISIYERAGFGVAGMFPVSHDSDRIIEYDCLLVRVKS